MNDNDCEHDWQRDARGWRCTKCKWLSTETGFLSLPKKGLGVGLFEFKEEEGGPTRNYVNQD